MLLLGDSLLSIGFTCVLILFSQWCNGTTLIMPNYTREKN
jgi:hypothetical protein